MSMNSYLAGHNGYRYIERDSTGKEMVPYRGQEMPPRDGCNVRITIDSEIQMIVETELEEAVKQYKPKMAVSILMRPQTGEILAMANRPNYNLNRQDDVTDEARVNCAVMTMVEPGSTFKIVTTAAALAQKLVNSETTINCEGGHFTYGGSTLHDHRPYGDLTIHDILVKSSNIGAAKLGIQLGDQKLYEYVRRFGFGERTGVALPWEIGGMVHPPHKWSKISITHVPMGQEVGVTPLQVVTAMSVIANGGKLMTPQIIHDITDSAGNTVATYPPTEIRRVIPEETAKLIRAALTDVVSKKGTAQLAHVDGFKVAGKTGTAQKAGPHGGYEHGKYVVSFVGFMPADKPELVAIVMLDDPKEKSDRLYGGMIAAPIFAKIATRVARYMNLEPTEIEPVDKAEGAKSEHEPD
jgi:cell division protein FtsI (penicillin-binding protein 3)/stage V sporulation protein D (sporulation-specific penicillin-binding protein)